MGSCSKNRSGYLDKTAASVPPQAWFGVSAVFHYLGPSFAVLLFPAIGVLGVAWMRVASAALIFAPWTKPWKTYSAYIYGDQAAALSVFEDGEQNRISLLARVGGSAATSLDAKYSKSAKSRRLEWSQGEFVYALVGDTEKAQLESMKMHVLP